MTLTVVTVPCLKDNYAFLIKDEDSGRVGVVDVPDATPIKDALTARGWTLTDVFFTHHHWDHIDGFANLYLPNLRVWGAAADSLRLPPLTDPVSPGDTIAFGNTNIRVWDVSGHTLNHIAFVTEGYAFTGDSLMSLGCGRLFEGTPAQMHASLAQFADLPGETLICSGHEYTASNGRFALTVDPDNAELQKRCAFVAAERAVNRPTVPTTLTTERATNPFLRSHVPALKHAANLPHGDEVEVFTAIRAAKDAF